MLSELLVPPAFCKRCRSIRIIKSGILNGKQRYQCKDCRTTFFTDQTSLHGRLPAPVLAGILENFYKGCTLGSIRARVEEYHGLQVSYAGIEKIIHRFSRQALRLTGAIRPPLQPVWIIEGSVIHGSRSLMLLDILDRASGFIISSNLISENFRMVQSNLFNQAFALAGFRPAAVFLGPDLLKFLEYSPDESSLNLAQNIPPETGWGLYKELSAIRTGIIQRRLYFDSLDNLKFINSVWRVHFNFLAGANPSGPASYNSWLEVINADDAPEGY